jgi:hypothetical protein
MISNPINKSIWAHGRTVKVLAWEVWPHRQRYKYKYNIVDISDCVIILSLFYVYWLKMYVFVIWRILYQCIDQWDE